MQEIGFFTDIYNLWLVAVFLGCLFFFGVLIVLSNMREETHFKDVMNVLKANKIPYSPIDLLVIKIAIAKLGSRDTIKILTGAYNRTEE